MNKHTLATVLVKVLGLSFFTSGVAQILSGLGNAFLFFNQFEKTSHQPNLSWQMFWNMGAYGLVYLGLGIFFILRTSYVVQNVLKFPAAE